MWPAMKYMPVSFSFKKLRKLASPLALFNKLAMFHKNAYETIGSQVCHVLQRNVC